MSNTTQTLAAQNLRFAGYISVATYGAKGDDVTIDNTALQNAWAAAATFGCNVYYPPGSYIVDRTGVQAYCVIMSQLSNMKHFGVKGKSVIKQKAGQPAATQVTMVYLDRCTDIGFQDLTFDGNWGNAQTTISETSTNTALPQATINVVDTTDFPAGPDTITVLTTSGAQSVTYTGKTATTFTGCAGGVGTMMRDYSVGYVDANTGINQGTQTDPKNHCLFIRGSTQITIDNCQFRQAYGDYIWLGGSNIDHTKWTQNVRILNCDGNMSARNGVTFGGAVIGCTIRNCNWTNVYAQAVDGEPQDYPVRDIVVDACRLGGWWDPSHLATGCIPLSVVGDSTSGRALSGGAALNWRVTNCKIEGTTFVEYARDVYIGHNHIEADWATTSFSTIHCMLGGGDITIDANTIYTRTSTAGTDAAGKGAITVYNYADASGQYDPANVRICNNRIHVRNGRYGLNIIAAGGAVQTLSGVADAVTATTVFKNAAGWTVNQFAGQIVRIGTAEMVVLSNTADTMTGDVVNNSSSSAWQTDAGNYAPTPAAGAFVVFRECGVIDIADNDIDGRDDGNGVSGYGMYIAMPGQLLGQRVRVHDNTIKSAGTTGIYVEWAAGGQRPYLIELRNNFGFDDQPVPTLTNLIQYSGNPGATGPVKWIMGGNAIGTGVTNVMTGLTAGTWLVSDGTVQQWAGYGSPAGVVTAPIGSTYQRLDGTIGTSLYINQTGVNTGWAAVGGLTTEVAAARINAGGSAFSKQEGFAGLVKNGVGDWTLQLSAATDATLATVLAQVQDTAGSGAVMNLTVQAVDTTHLRVRTFSAGVLADLNFWISVSAIN